MTNGYTERDVLVQVHTTIAEREREEIAKNGWNYNDLIRLGMLAKKENPQLISRIRELEDKVCFIMRKLKI